MTKTEMIEAIRKACINVNPEIVELKFGCVIFPDYFVVENYGKWQEEKGLGVLCLDPDSGFLTRVPFYENDMYVREIIGREIGLSDVLYMFGISKINVQVGNMGRFFKYPEKIYSKIEESWDLAKPLNLQSEETIRFIFNLLKND